VGFYSSKRQGDDAGRFHDEITKSQQQQRESSWFREDSSLYGMPESQVSDYGEYTPFPIHS
jgi:hypothetical protein